MDTGIPTLVLAGTPYEMGRKHGEAFGPVIRTLARQNLESVIALARTRANLHLTPQDILARLEPHRAAVKHHLPELYEETEGIASGAQIPFEQVFALNAFLDIFDLTFPTVTDKTLYGGGCTAFGISGPRNRWAFLGQNYDVRAFFEEGVFLMDLRPAHAPRALVPTVAGMVGCAGLNESGLGLVINNLTPKDAQPGIPHQYMVRHVLAQQRIGDAVNAVTAAPRASGFSYLIGDRSGELIGLETSATRYAVYLVEQGGYACHCNHYVTPQLLDQEGTPGVNGDSIARYGRARHRLMQVDGDDPAADLQALCADHTNHPYSICRHALPAGEFPFVPGKTVFSVLFDLPKTTAYICKGNPCTTPYGVFSPAG